MIQTGTITAGRKVIVRQAGKANGLVSLLKGRRDEESRIQQLAAAPKPRELPGRDVRARDR